ncbi:MAG: radical SAM protein, partial [Treponema sp.]|nr:radical SAM protein [Treponema sp.]
MGSKSPGTGRPFVVMAKPVGSRCNLSCEYCYYKRSSDNQHLNPMTDELLELFIRQYIEASEGPEVNIVWHGGEPTLAGLDFYRRAVELQKRYLPEGWTCRNNLQTNGVLLDDEWCAFIAEARFDVGLSIDGTERLHDQYRKDHEGKGSYQKAVAAIRRLKARGVQPDLLCTVTSSAAMEAPAVYRALRELDTGWIQFIPIVRRDSEDQLTPDSVTANAYGDFLTAIFDEWAFHDIGRLDVQLFAEAARVWSGGAAGLCWMASTCGRALIVEMDGSVYSC